MRQEHATYFHKRFGPSLKELILVENGITMDG